MSLKVNTNVGPVNGARSDADFLVIAKEMTGVNHFDQTFMRNRPGGVSAIRFRNTRPSAFLDNGAIATASQSVVNGLVEIAARRAMDHIYCVQLVLEIPTSLALGLETDRRLRLHDVRLPGGKATGWITDVRFEFSGDTDSALVTMLCPVVAKNPVTAGTEVSFPNVGPVRVFRQLGAPGYQPQKPGIIGAIEDGDGNFFVSGVQISGDATAQKAILDEINNKNSTSTNPIEAALDVDAYTRQYAIQNAEDHLPDVQIAVNWQARQVSEDLVDEVEIGQVSIRIDEGISYG